MWKRIFFRLNSMATNIHTNVEVLVQKPIKLDGVLKELHEGSIVPPSQNRLGDVGHLGYGKCKRRKE